MKRPVLARALAIWIAALLTAGLLIPGTRGADDRATERASGSVSTGTDRKPRGGANGDTRDGETALESSADPPGSESGAPGTLTPDGRRISRDPADLGSNFRDRAFEERTLSQKPHPKAVEIARGDLPDDRGAWRLWEFPEDGSNSFCLATKVLTYNRGGAGSPFASSIGGGRCTFDLPLDGDYQRVEGVAELWVGVVDPQAVEVEGRVLGHSARVDAHPMRFSRNKAWAVVLPESAGQAQLVARAENGSEVGRHPRTPLPPSAS